MQSIRCTSCDAKLKLPESFTGDTVKCPKCGRSFSTTHAIAEQTRAAEQSPSVEQTRSEPPQPRTTAAPTFTEPDPGLPSQLPDQLAVAAATRQANTSANKTPAVFDFRFTRYWTPMIIRFSWFVVLIFVILWIGFLSVAFVGTLFGGQNTSMLDSFGLSDFSVSSLDIEGALSGKADVDSLNKFLDNVTESGSTGPVKPKKTTYQSIMSFGFTTLSFLTLIASMILTVLFCRVFFETIIVLFDMSKTLKSIDEKTD